MESFFQNQIYVLFAIIIYYILINDQIIKESQKISIIYIFISCLSLFDILDLKPMMLIMLLIFFVYFEILYNDTYKVLIIKKIYHKFIDYFYLLVFRYNFLLYVFSLIFISESFLNKFNIPYNLNLIIFVVLLYYVLQKNVANQFELYSFDYIFEKMKKYNFGNFALISYDKAEMIITIEDKSFFARKNDYTYICWDFLKYRIDRIREIVDIIQISKGYKHSFRKIVIFIKYVIKQCWYQLQEIIHSGGYLLRGYSTIDMQLFRTIAVKNGYEKKFQRKIAELIYSQLFFKGLRNYFKLNYTTVSSKRFKNYLLNNYLFYAPMYVNGKMIPMEKFWNKDIYSINNSEFLLSVLCYPGRIDLNNLSNKYIFKNFYNYIDEFKIDKNEMKKAIDDMKKCYKKLLKK